MKKLLLGGIALLAAVGAASAADIPARMPVKAAPVAAYDWNGFYLGGYWGTAVGQSTGRISGTSDEAGVNELALTGGLTAGYNWQVNPKWLVGLEGDIGYLGINRTFNQYNDADVTVGLKTDWYGTVRARTGYVTGPSLLYVTGGAALVRMHDIFGGDTTVPYPPLTYSTTKIGWTVGGGIETKLSRNWSSKTEYLFIDAGNTSFTENSTYQTPMTISHQFHIFKSGLNYQFGGAGEGLPFFNTALLTPKHGWAGFYAGVNVGGGLSVTRVSGVSFRTGENDINGGGFAGGVQAGYNVMLDPKWFAGVEGDIGYLGLDRTVADWNDSANHITFSQNTGWYGTIRGRAGATTGPALLYLTGGVAWVRVRDGLTNPGCFLCGTVSEVTTRTASGWTFGGGTEVALGMRLSAKLEYLYMDVGRSVLTDGSTWDAEFHNRFQIVRAGLNYKLGD